MLNNINKYVILKIQFKPQRTRVVLYESFLECLSRLRKHISGGDTKHKTAAKGNHTEIHTNRLYINKWNTIKLYKRILKSHNFANNLEGIFVNN